MSLPSWPLGCLWYDRPQHLDLMALNVVWFSWLRSVLSWFESHLSSRSLHVKCDSLYIPLPGLCWQSFTLYYVHHPTQYSYDKSTVEGNRGDKSLIASLSFNGQLPPLRRWHSTLSLLLFIRLWLEHYSPSECPSANHFLYGCKSLKS